MLQEPSAKGPFKIEWFKAVVDLNCNGTFEMLSKTAWEMAKNEPNEEGERVSS